MEEALRAHNMGGDPEKVPDPLPPKHQTPKGLQDPENILKHREEMEKKEQTPPPPPAEQEGAEEGEEPPLTEEEQKLLNEPEFADDPDTNVNVMDNQKYKDFHRQLFQEDPELKPENKVHVEKEKKSTTGSTALPAPPPPKQQPPKRKLKKVEYYGSSSSSEEDENEIPRAVPIKKHKKRTTSPLAAPPPLLPQAPLNAALGNRKTDMQKAFFNPFNADPDLQDQQHQESMMMSKAFSNRINDVKRKALMRAIFGD